MPPVSIAEKPLDATPRTARQWAELAPELRRSRFFMAQVEDERLLDFFRGLCDEAIRGGISEAEFVHRAKLALAELDDPDGKPYYDPQRYGLTEQDRLKYDANVRHIDSTARLKLIFRTQWELAAGQQEWESTLDPDWLAMFPGWRFVRQPGAKIKRKDHASHEGDVRLVTDTAYWLARNSPDQGGFNNPFPPFGYNSWMHCEPVSREECEQLGLLKKGEKINVPPELERWKLPAAVEQSGAVSLKSLSAEGKEHLQARAAREGMQLHDTQDGRTLSLPVEKDPQPSNATQPHDTANTPTTLRPAEKPARPGDILRLPRQPDRPNDDQSGNPREKAGPDLLHPRPLRDGDAGGESQDARRDRLGVGVAEVYSRCDEALRSLAPQEASRIVETTTAQLNAVYAGRKPAFLETNPALVRPFAENLPRGMRYIETAHAACIYHEQAAARELGLPAGEPLHTAARLAVESGDCGLLLGYGAPSILTRPSHQVTITRNGAHFSGFISSADEATARRYATERTLDFARQFPNDKWSYRLQFKN